MRKSLNKFALLIVVALFMTSCFSTKQSCGLAQSKDHIKKENYKTLYKEGIVLKSKTYVLVANAN